MFTVTQDRNNKDIPAGMDRHQARQYYLDMYGDFQGKMPRPVVERFEDKWVFRADLAPAGFKAYGGEKVIAETKEDTLVYCAPRVGHAPDAIAQLAQMYGKKCVFFCPASSRASNHQAVLKAYGDTVDLRFIRIAAMPTLNVYAKRWAEKNGAKYLPFGLSGVPMVTSGLVNAAKMVSEEICDDPTQIWCAVSTGTMIRALQIGWPDAEAHGIAVARNMHDGEIGTANVVSSSIPFLRPVKPHELPPFPTTANYDAKAWDAFVRHGKPGSIFINVGSDHHIERRIDQVDFDSISSAREWGDMSDFERGV